MAQPLTERLFALRSRGSSVGREVLGGVTTYLTMVYIVFVQPVVMAKAGMDFGAVTTATCLASAIACFIMGLWANYPVALAPGMGSNFFFALAVVVGMGFSWQEALGAVFVAGVAFLLVSLVGVRERIINGLPEGIKAGITAGIGLLIAFVGLQWSGLVVAKPGTLVGLGNLKDPVVLLGLGGLGIISLLLAWRVPGAILLGMLITAGIGAAVGMVSLKWGISSPPSIKPVLFKMDFSALPHSFDLVVVAITFFFLDMFDTIGTLVGIAPAAGLMKDGKLVGASRALTADSVGTIVGAAMGISTITSYVESAAGIQAGARTGLAAVVTGILLCLTPFFYPVVEAIGAGVKGASGLLHPVTAPVLIVVGVMMTGALRRVEWDKVSEAIPAFLTMIMMPMTLSITEGISFGLISYCVLALLTGRPRSVGGIMYLCAAVLLARYFL